MTGPKDNPIAEVEVRQALEHITRSRFFNASERLRRFLGYTVEGALAGRENELKEMSIGMHVYDRKPAYETRDDSIVRTEARRLRNKLRDYYLSDGKDDPVIINYHPGNYVPTFERHQTAQEIPAAPPAASGQRPPENNGVTMAVLPIVDLSNTPYSSRCARGLASDLVHGWARIEGITVVNLEVFSPASSPASALIDADKPGLIFIIDGSVWEENQFLRVTMRLTRSNGVLVWSQRFEAKADSQGLLELTERLVTALIGRLRPETSVLRKARQAIAPEIVAVLPMLFEAEALLEEGSTANLQVALTKLQEVVQRTPDFARPYCSVASCHCIATLHGVADPASRVAKAVAAAERAVELDPDMTRARTSLASVQLLQWKWKEAEASFQKALAAGDHTIAFRQYAMFLTTLGRFDEAGYYIEQAHRTDPFSGRQKIARNAFFYFARRTNEMLADFAHETDFGPVPVEANLLFALALIQNGQHEEAKRVALTSRRDASTQPNLMAHVAMVLVSTGDESQARHIADALKFFSPSSPISRWRQALLWLAFGNLEEAWAALSKAVEEKEPELVWLNVEPKLDPLRQDPRFARLLDEVIPLSMR